jgi:excisionase family DNA binding protein
MDSLTSNKDAGETRMLYRVGTAAQRLDISRSQLYKLLGRGDIRAVKVGNSIRIPVSEMERIAAAGTERRG